MLIEMRDIFTVVLIVVNNRNWFHPFDAKSNMPTCRISRERRALCIMILPVFHFVTLFMWVLMMMMLLRYMELSRIKALSNEIPLQYSCMRCYEKDEIDTRRGRCSWSKLFSYALQLVYFPLISINR